MELRNTMRVAAFVGVGSVAGAQTVHYDLVGVTADDEFGHAVASAGDVDGDGVADWIVGAPGDPLASGALPGYAVIYSGVDGSPIRTHQGTESGAGFGFSVGSMGDLDGDGLDDVIVGSPFHADPAKGPEIGNIRIFSGGDGSLLRTLDGNLQGMRFGYAVAGVGDVNQDGTPDFAVGSPRDSKAGGGGLRPGTVRVHSGKNSFLLKRHEGPADLDGFGTSLARVGDVDGDGSDDIAVGAPQGLVAGTPGYARLFSGRTGVLMLHVAGGGTTEVAFGEAVGDAGDVDGDGKADLVVGAPLGGTGEAGLARVLSSAGGATLLTFTGNPGDHLGSAVHGAGDMDGDGVPDLLIGSPDSSVGGPGSGRAVVFSGADGSALVTLDGKSSGERLGRSVAGGADLDGDGLPEVAAGAPKSASTPGMASVFSAGGAAAPSLVADPTQVSMMTGGTVAFTLDAGPDNAHSFYWMFGSATGSSPGISLGGGLELPLVFDLYTLKTLVMTKSKFYQGFRGFLDRSGQGSASLLVKHRGDPNLIGVKLYHAFVSAQNIGLPNFVSNAVEIELVP